MAGMITLHFVEHDSKGMIISIILVVPAKDRPEIENGHSIPSCITKSSLRVLRLWKLGLIIMFMVSICLWRRFTSFSLLLLLDEFWAALSASICIREGEKCFVLAHFFANFISLIFLSFLAVAGLVSPSSSRVMRREQQDYYSTLHKTPNRKKFTKKEWDKFTQDSTRQAVAEWASSPEFTDWIIEQADRIQLLPSDSSDETVGSGSDSTEENVVESRGNRLSLFKWYWLFWLYNLYYIHI